LRADLPTILPSLAERDFDRVAVCWYNDTPSGDFIIDYHPDLESVPGKCREWSVSVDFFSYKSSL
jgi:glycine/D-amino acid oxidase-like deaminating enzyme